MVEIASEVLRDLGDGLVMRRSTIADAERLAEFNSRIHGEDSYDAAAVGAWTRDLLVKDHPTFGKGDYLYIENVETGEIVSTLNLISQSWSYAGIPFKVGRPELVGTDERYRNRGLVREMFQAVHEISQQRGELVQVITGIPYFYRQFGYEMTLDLGGGRSGFEANVPKLEEGQEEAFRVREAGEADVHWLMHMIERDNRRSMVSSIWDEALLRHEMFEKSVENVNRLEWRVIETVQGQPVGYLAHPRFAWWGTIVGLVLFHYGLEEGFSYLAVTPSVIRYLWSTGQEYASERGRTANGFGFWLGIDHPAYHAVRSRLPYERKPYAYYVRVPDLPAFLRQIAPVLETRLKNSDFAGHSGELKISFYRNGLRLVFDCGRLSLIEAWNPREGKEAAAFPDLTFLQMVFGSHTLDEIRSAYPDCWANDEAAVLLGTIFPKKYSSVNAIS